MSKIIWLVLLASLVQLCISGDDIVAPRHWKQRGRAPIVLPVYDATTDPLWAPIIQEAIGLWSGCPAFVLNYQKTDILEVPNSGKAGIYVHNYQTPVPTYTWIDFTRNVINWTWIQFSDSVFQQPGSSDAYNDRQRRRIIRHEMGHSLGLDHVFDADGFPDPYDVMGSGMDVTRRDIDALCRIYNCK